MKKIFCIFSLIALLAMSGQAMAFSFTFNAVPPTAIGLGDAITVNIELGLTNLEALDYFNFNLSFDNAILGYTGGSSIFLNTFADPDYAGDITDNGSYIAINGINFATPLSNGLFTLASLNFIGNAYGHSPLNLSGELNLKDPTGADISAQLLVPGGVDVSAPVPPVPEPGTFVLLGLGLAGLVGYRRKFRKE